MAKRPKSRRIRVENDENLERRIGECLGDRHDVVEKRMFGGVAFMVGGHMLAGVVGEDLMIRVGPEAYEAALELPHARPMDFTGRPLKGFLFVEPGGVDSYPDLQEWLDRGLAFVTALPPKEPKAGKKVASTKKAVRKKTAKRKGPASRE